MRQILGDLFDTTSETHARCPALHLAARLAVGSIRAWSHILATALTPNPPPLASSAFSAHIALLASENLIIAKLLQSLTAKASESGISSWMPPVLTSVFASANTELLRHTDSVPYTDCNEELATLREWISARKWSVVSAAPSHAGTVALIFDVEDSEGKRYVAKVLRVGIQERLRASLAEAWPLVPLLGYVGGIGVETAQQALAMIGDMLMLQTDLMAEGRHCERFGAVCQHIKGLRVPMVVEATDKLLVMERLDGVPLSLMTSLSRDKHEYSRVLIKMWVITTLLHGLVHADPHVGNVLFKEEDRSIGLVDFGLVYEATEAEQERMRGAWERVVEQSDAVEGYSIEQCIADLVLKGGLEPVEAIDGLSDEEYLVVWNEVSKLLRRILRRQDIGLMSLGAFWGHVREARGCEKVTLSRYGIQVWQSIVTIRSVALALCEESPSQLMAVVYDTLKELLHLDLFDVDIGIAT